MNNLQGEWCVGGDFNSISKVGERKGRSNGGGNQSERVEFSQFIDAMELIDIPISGKKFSWFSSDGSSMSRLDRFLLSEGFIEKGGIKLLIGLISRILDLSMEPGGGTVF
jgi:hypothetical protein